MQRCLLKFYDLSMSLYVTCNDMNDMSWNMLHSNTNHAEKYAQHIFLLKLMDLVLVFVEIL